MFCKVGITGLQLKTFTVVEIAFYFNLHCLPLNILNDENEYVSFDICKRFDVIHTRRLYMKNIYSYPDVVVKGINTDTVIIYTFCPIYK